ncbi:hypothetical protein D3C73_1059440 [compost metagenome]
MFKFLQPDTVLINFGFNIAVCRAGEGHGDRAGATVAWQANDANVVREVFTAKLCANTKLAAGIEQRRLQCGIAERLTQFVAAGWQVIVIFC